MQSKSCPPQLQRVEASSISGAKVLVMIAALSVGIRVLVRPEWAELTNVEVGFLPAGRISEVGGLPICCLSMACAAEEPGR